MKHLVEDLVKQALSGDFLVIHPKPEFGDYSVNVTRFSNSNPAEFAKELATKLTALDSAGNFESIETVGGFINFKLSKKVLGENVEKIVKEKEKYGTSNIGQGKTVVVEYFQNNVAKPPHVGHLRSAVIGDSIKRIFTALGYNTISDTHVGDWGVQFGILLYAYKTMGDKATVEKDPIQELNKLYVEMSKKIEEDPSLRDKGKEEFVKLEKGDDENRKLWLWFVEESLKDFKRYGEMLKLLSFDVNYGEAFYEDKMPAVLEELENKGLVKVGEDGEKYVDLEDEGLGRCILVKSDGGTTYHMRDFATYTYIRKTYPYFKHVYVVDNRQSHHFRQLFTILEKAGYPANSDAVHVDLGFMSLPEGAISTRKGTTISLEALLSEATKRAMEIIKEKNPDLDNKDEVAEKVALAAVKYFDLSHNRKSEIVFTWDKALSFDGNTGPYMQYTFARIQGILRKSSPGVIANPESPRSTRDDMESTELNLLRKLVYYPEVIQQAGREYLPNLICNYLFELSQCFNSFYEAVPVNNEIDEDKKNFRIQLINGVAQVIENGLELLGIETIPRM